MGTPGMLGPQKLWASTFQVASADDTQYYLDLWKEPPSVASNLVFSVSTT